MTHNIGVMPNPSILHALRRLTLLGLLLGAACGAHAQPAQITIAVSQNHYPYTDVEDDKAIGLGPDIVRAAFASMGVTVAFESMPHHRCVIEAGRGVVMACLAVGRDNPHFKSGKLFPSKTPLFAVIPALFASSESKLQALTLADLAGKQIVFPKDANYGDDLERVTRGNRVESLTELTGLRMLMAGRAELLAGDPRSVGYLERKYAQELAGRLKVVSQAGGYAGTMGYAAFSKKLADAPHWAALLDQGLAKIHANGEYERINARWSGQLR